MASVPLLSKYKLLRKRLKIDIRSARESFFANKLRDTAVGNRSSSPLEVFSANELNTHYASVATVDPLCSADELARILDISLKLNEPVFDVAELTNVQVLQAATAVFSKCKGRSFDRLQLNDFEDYLCVVSKFMTKSIIHP